MMYAKIISILTGHKQPNARWYVELSLKDLGELYNLIEKGRCEFALGQLVANLKEKNDN